LDSGARRIIVLSGQIASGKSTLARGLAKRLEAQVFRTQDLLRDRIGRDATREEMQKAGAELDRNTNGEWVADALGRMTSGSPMRHIVIDSVRQENQVEGLRRAFGATVTHVHLQAPLSALEGRFSQRSDRVGEAKTYAEAASDPIEAVVDQLWRVADVVVDTTRSTEADVLV
jgi:adenylosuccinate synthase